MNLGPLADMHPIEQAIRADINAQCYDNEGVGAAVLAVLELHNCRPVGLWKWPTCGHCEEQECPVEWPCDTVKAIANAMDVTI
jgi:hypothetical protein